MNETDTPVSPSPGERDLSAAIEALNEYLSANGQKSARAVVESDILLIGHLRTLAAALNGIHIPGYRAITADEIDTIDWSAVGTYYSLGKYTSTRMPAIERTWFVAVDR